jgi:acetyltransferase
MNLLPLLKPQSVAVIGASRDTTKIGAQILQNLTRAGFEGKIIPVNPKADLIQGYKSYPAVTAIPDKIDLAIIAIPRQFIKDTVGECIEKKVGSIIIITAGFKETDEEGKQLERDIAHKLKQADIPLLGPNCLGIIIPGQKLNASFAAQMPKDGPVVFISQSGAFGTAAIDWASNHHIGFSHFISLGNKALLTETELLHVANAKTKAIAMYLEEITGGNKFIDTAQRIGTDIPIIILKPGKSKKAQEAAKSHTGSLTGSDKIIEVALKQAGVLRANTSQELFNLIKAFSYLPELKGNKIAIVTNAGGPSIMATDAIEEAGLQLAEISPKAQNELKQYLPRESNVHDPIDVIGDAKADRYDHALQIVLDQPTVDGCIVIVTPQTSTEIETTAQLIIKHAKTTDKPIIAAFLGGTLVDKGVEILSKNGIACFHYPEQAVYVLSRMWEHQKNKSRAKVLPPIHNITHIPHPRHEVLIEKAKTENRNLLLMEEAEQLLAGFGIQAPPKCEVTSPDEAYQKALDIGTPVVLKISSPTIIHKTEEGAIVTNLTGEEHIKDTYRQLALVAKHHDQSTIFVQKQLPKGVELLLGMKRDPLFGPIIVVGTGGIYTEIYKDTSSRIAPLTRSQAEEMLKETKVYTILNSYRNGPQYPIEKIIHAIINIADLSLTYDEIKEIDINPLLINEEAIYALDARIVL